jgi:putative redox protein
MITARDQKTAYLTRFSDGKHDAASDASTAKGGQGAGFGPHELLEAALAACVNIWVRMQAAQHGIPLDGISVTVSLERDDPHETVYDCGVILEGALSEAQRTTLLEAAQACPVRRTLAKKPCFRLREAAPGR